MALSPLDLGLAIATVVVLVADIILALCLRFVLPKHITHKGYYPADGRVATYQEALDLCPCLARVFPDGTKDDIRLIKVEDNMARRRKREIEDSSVPPEEITMGKYPFLVSLSIPAYVDDPSQMIFACNGFIQTANTLVTTKSCVKEETEWYHITVRSGSPYWSKGGQKHSVGNVTHADYDLIILEIYPSFPDSAVPYPPIKYPYGGNWTYSFTAGWDDKMYQKKPQFRFKYKKFDVEEWTTQNCTTKKNQVCSGLEECTQQSSKFLMSSCHQILGLKYHDGKGECDQFSGVGLKVSGNTTTTVGRCYNVYGGVCSSKLQEVCVI